jgi:3-deoxy-7-phosphoheptulonate synthase
VCSQKKHDNQKVVAADLAAQITSGSRQVMGVMIESNLVAGRQDVGSNPKLLKYHF